MEARPARHCREKSRGLKKMRVLPLSIIAVMLISGAYAQQAQPGAYAPQPGAYQQPPGAYQQQPGAYVPQPGTPAQPAGRRYTCSGLKTSCERGKTHRTTRTNAGVDCETTFRSCMST